MAAACFRASWETPAKTVDVKPTPAEQERKREMCLAYPSQGDFLSRFDVSREIVRPQPAYDFTRPPHEGKTNYEVWQWSMTAQRGVRRLRRIPARTKQRSLPRRHRAAFDIYSGRSLLLTWA